MGNAAYAPAADALRKAAGIDPGNELYAYKLALSLDRLDKTEDALPFAQRAVSLAPGRAANRLLLGTLYGKLDRFSDAERELRKCIELDSTMDLAYYRLSRVYARHGDAAQAREYVDKWKREHAAGVTAQWSEQAREALARHDMPAAVSIYAQILEIDPENAPIHAAHGVAFYGLGQPEKAAAALETALRLDPQQSNTEVFLGLSRAELGQCDRALPVLRKHFDDRDTGKTGKLAGLALVSCAVSTGDFQLAADTLRALEKTHGADADVLYHQARVYSLLSGASATRLLQTHPDSYRLHQLAAESLELQGKTSQAIREYRKVLDINPTASGANYRIGRLTGEAEWFERELLLHPNNAAAEYELGEISGKAHQADEAKRHLRRAVELAPTFFEAHIALGKLLGGDEAVRELQAAISLQPDNGSAHYALMLVYRDLGKTEEARREMETFRKIDAQKTADFNALLHTLTGEGPK